MATASEDQTVKLWDLQTGVELNTLRGHESGVWTVAFSPDGRRLASGGLDGVVVGMFVVGSPATNMLYSSMVRLGLAQSGQSRVVDGSGLVLFDSAYRQIGNPLRIAGLSMTALGPPGAQRTKDVDGNDIVSVPLAEAINKVRTVPAGSVFIQIARSLGISLGESEVKP